MSDLRNAFTGPAGVYAATGVFVAFEGGEGAGKSTQARRLADWLERRRLRRAADPRARRHRGRPQAAPDRARPGHRGALAPHRGAALRRRQGRARRHRRPAGAGPGRGRDHRPLRRLDAGLPGRRPRRCRPGGRAGRPLGHRRPAPAPDGPARPRPSTGWAGSRSATGSRASRWSSTSGSARRSSQLAAADPEHYLVVDARRRSTRSPPRPAAGRARCCRTPPAGRAADAHAGRRDARDDPTGWSTTTSSTYGRVGWSTLVGQERTVETLRRAAAGAGHDATPGCSPARPARAAPTPRSRSPPRCSASDRRLRRLPRLPHRAGRHPRRRQRHPHREARARRRRRCASWSAARRSRRPAGAGR